MDQRPKGSTATWMRPARGSAILRNAARVRSITRPSLFAGPRSFTTTITERPFLKLVTRSFVLNGKYHDAQVIRESSKISPFAVRKLIKGSVSLYQEAVPNETGKSSSATVSGATDDAGTVAVTGIAVSWRAEVGLAATKGTAMNIINASERLIFGFTRSPLPGNPASLTRYSKTVVGTVALPRKQQFSPPTRSRKVYFLRNAS